MRRTISLLAGLACALGLTLLLPSAASAHDVLQATNPVDGSTVDTLPGSVSLTFSEPPLAMGAQIIVTGPGGPVAEGAPTIEGGVISQALSPSAPGGNYTVTYRVTADDGHPVTGRLTFYASTGLDGAPAASARTEPAPAPVLAEEESTPTDADSGGLFVPILLTIVGSTVLLGVGAFIFLRTRRRGVSRQRPRTSRS